MRSPFTTAIALFVLLAAASSGSGAATTVDFDDRPGKPGPFFGEPCPVANQVRDEYLTLGIRFESDDPTVCLLEAFGPPSPPNVATGMNGGEIDFSAPVIATFHQGGSPSTVGRVEVTITNGSTGAPTLQAFDLNGNSLGGSGKTGPGTHSVTYPGLIHEVRISAGGGFFSVDDFVFDDPPWPVPAMTPHTMLLAALALALAGGWALARRA